MCANYFVDLPNPQRSLVLIALGELEDDLWRHVMAHIPSLISERNLPSERRTNTRLNALYAVRVELTRLQRESAKGDT